MRHVSPGFIAALGLLLVTAPAHAQDFTFSAPPTYSATADCNAPIMGHVDWPADNPVWSFDYVRPTESSGTDGSGLEILNAYYRGYLVFKRAHTPILNVEYDGSGCGCFRDWNYSEAGFAVTGIRPGGCFADATPGTVQTTCDSNQDGGMGGDTGSFRGVAIEEYDDELVLTTHMNAGWYRYRMKWHFYRDGRVRPEYSFASASAVCTDQSRRHHVYYRFDFDLLEGQPNNGEDQIYEVNPATNQVKRLAQEAQRTWGDPADGVFWAVRDASLRAGYKIIPSPSDLALPVDSFSKLDMMAVKYVPGEFDDDSPGCAIDPDRPQLVSGESLVGEDVVLWYRASAGKEAGTPWQCDVAGPTLEPFRNDGRSRSGAEPTVEEFMSTAPLRAAAEASTLPEGYVLEGARPNPFDATTSVRFQVAEAQDVTVALYDALGRRVAVLYEGTVDADQFRSVEIDGRSLPSGTYTVVLEGVSVRGSTRVVLIK
ncbi:MAG: T9SS type A sorting domain-containing protein [Bacteroidota bacterium]